MTICFFGYPNHKYSRNKIIINGLRSNNSTVVYCHEKSGLAPIRYLRLFKKFWPLRHRVDVILVEFPGQLNMPIAWVLGKLFAKPVILDAFVSMYDTYIFDRQIASVGSLTAKFYWWVDKLACILADHVTLDTNAHIRYFVRTFKLDQHKFSRLPVGGDDTIFKPESKLYPKRGRRSKRKIIIEFHGMFTKLHGAEIFVKAAKFLENRPNLEFWLIGSTQNYLLPLKLYRELKPKTLHYWPRMTAKNLAFAVSRADISVGHLGPTQKARMVVTNKMFHALATKTALIAADNPASREFLNSGVDCLLVRMYDAKDLVKKIVRLSQNQHLRRKIALGGYSLHRNNYTNRLIGLKLLQIISKHFPHIR